MFQWLSPSFPTGSFNFSQGLEYAVSQSMVKNEADLVVWIENNLEHGFLRNDAIFLKLAYQISTDKDLDDLTELCLAFSCSASKLNELVMTGDNFAKASETPLGLPYPIALGTAAKKHKLKLAKIDDLIAYRLNREKLIKLKKSSTIKIKKQNYNIKIFENLLDGSENFALIKGNIKKNKNPRVRVISSNIVKNYLMGEKLPNSFNQTIAYFKNHKDCVLIFIRDTNLRSVSEVLKTYKEKKFYKKGNDKLIKNYGIGAQIIKDLKIKKMILITKSPKKVIGSREEEALTQLMISSGTMSMSLLFTVLLSPCIASTFRPFLSLPFLSETSNLM